MNKKLFDIIVCGPAVGKTYLSKIDSRFIDLDQMKAKYKYDIKNEEDFEKNKLNRGKTIQNDSFEYALNILKTEIKNNKIILLSFNKELLDYIIKNNLKYCLVYPNINCRNEYINRMKNRGNPDKFIEAMTNENIWNYYYEQNKSDIKPYFKIELNPGQYLSDIKNKFFEKN